jgi:cytoskeletal protein RodZ
MGGQVRGVPQTSALTEGARASIGGYLARQRRLRGISLEELSGLTKIPRRSLERLEAGAFDAEADGFARGFVRTVAVALGLNPEEAVMRLLGEPLDLGKPTSGPWTRRWLWLISGLAVAAASIALAIWGWRSGAGLSATEDDRPKIVYRRDAVRALAESQTAPPGSQPGRE